MQKTTLRPQVPRKAIAEQKPFPFSKQRISPPDIKVCASVNY